MQTFTLNAHGQQYKIRLTVRVYPGGNLAIAMEAMDRPDGYWEPWSVLTVNLGTLRAKDCAYIDTNNNDDAILDWIADNNLAYPTGATGHSGYCHYPEYRFNPELLQQIDPLGYAAYIQQRESML